MKFEIENLAKEKREEIEINSLEELLRFIDSTEEMSITIDSSPPMDFEKDQPTRYVIFIGYAD